MKPSRFKNVEEPVRRQPKVLEWFNQVQIMNEGKPHICLVAHYAYGALIGGSNGHIGGVERQTSLLAKWLAAKGYPVSMVTWDEGQTDGREIDGVSVYKLCRKDAGGKGVRFF